MSTSPRDVNYFDRVIDVTTKSRTTLRVVDVVKAPPATLRADEVSGNVFKLKQALAYLGHLDTGLVDDSWCDEATSEALRAFQRDAGLVDDAIYGAKSQKALDIALNGGLGQEDKAPPPAADPPPASNPPPAANPPSSSQPASNPPKPGECTHCDALQKAVDNGSISKCKKGEKSEDAKKLIVALQKQLLAFNYFMGSFGPDKNGVDGDYGATTSKRLEWFRKEVGLSTKNSSADALLAADVAGLRQKCSEKFRTKSPHGPSRLDEVPAAPLPTGEYYWPLLNPRTTKVYSGPFHELSEGAGRHFGARRGLEGGVYKRVHVGVDLFGQDGDVVIAAEAGKIVNYYKFLSFTARDGKAGEVWAIIVANDSGTVINYSEVKKNSNTLYNWKIGDKLKAGQPFAQLQKMRDDAMLHFETYASGTTANTRWLTKDSPPSKLRNPTNYLLELAKKTKRS